jgi:pilus assembly protein CpaF
MNAVIYGLGPLERWIADTDVTEIMVNGGTDVWIERTTTTGGAAGPQYAGQLATGVIDAIIERILAPAGRRLDRSSPVVDTRLPDGSRVCAVLPPVAVDGPCLSLRRFASRPIELDRFASADVCALLRAAITGRCNIVVSGATSSGKTTLLNAIARLVDPGTRLITLEDTAELQLGAPHVLRLETRPASPDGVAAVDLAALLHTALRLRPDRLVVGEIRGDEALHLVQAMNTGHDGSLCTIHANSPADALARIESLVLRGSPAWSLPAVRDQVRRSVDVVVHVSRVRGVRRITTVAEVATAGEGSAVRPLAVDDTVVGGLLRRRA